MNDGSFCPSHLLEDDPELDDQFGSHKPVAQALATTVEDSEGGRAVALIGPYGSGKSTIVNMFRQRLEQDSQSRGVFVFDAWAHQGDPLRRSFLEAFRAFLVRKGWIDPKSLSSDFEDLAKRHETSKTIPRPAVTNYGLWVGALIPVAAASLGLASYRPAFALGALIPLVPVLLALIRSERKGDEQRLLLSDLLIGKPRDIVETATIRTPEPTSVEFREFFEKLLSLAFKTRDHTLAIVLDNLDRLDPGQALGLLATMRTFFDGGSQSTSKGGKRRLWLLVPFDTDWLKHVGDGRNPGSIGNEILTKTFQARFYVSEPTLPNLRSYLLGLLGQAFPVGSHDFGTIYLLFSWAVRHEKQSQTPRNLKVFVNRLVVSHLIWRDNIPLSVQAAYVLFQGEQGEFVKRLQDGSLLHATVVGYLSHVDWQSGFAALFYNLPPQKAMHVFLSGPIIETVEDGSRGATARLAEIAARDHDVFAVVCEAVVSENRTAWGADVKMAARACYVLGELGVLEFGEIPRKNVGLR